MHWPEQAHFWLQFRSHIANSRPLLEHAYAPTTTPVLTLDDGLGSLRVDLLLYKNHTPFVAHRIRLVDGQWEHWACDRAIPLFHGAVPQPNSPEAAQRILSPRQLELAQRVIYHWQC